MSAPKQPALPLYGFFSAASQDTPERDPGTAVPCHVCGDLLTARPMKTVSFIPMDSGYLSYFYRLHKDCATPEIECYAESFIVDSEPAP